MADGKKTVVVYADWISIFEKLSDAESGRLIKHFFRYINDLNPEPADRITELTFEPIKCTLKRDLVRYEAIRQKRSEAGKSGGRPKIEGNKQTEAKKTNAFFVKQTEAKKTDSDSDSDSVLSKESVITARGGFLPEIKKSNLFRQPVIPDYETVERVFTQQGGSREMAKKFFDKHSATGWYYNNSPITQFHTLVPGFITNWNRNNNKSQSAERKRFKL